MIASDQPSCFPDNVLVRVSSRLDGTVLDRAVGVHNPEIVTNRTQFCANQGIDYGDVVYQRIIYDEQQTYDRIALVGEKDTCKYKDEVQGDALVTFSSGVGLLLPVADCVATVIFDKTTNHLAMVHLGRHSTIANLMPKILACMKDEGSEMQDLIIWMAPAVQRAHYRMEYFDHSEDAQWQDFCEQRNDGYYLDLPDYNRARAIEAGVLASNIHISPVDTAVDDNYFSHSRGDTTGRFAVLAMVRHGDTN